MMSPVEQQLLNNAMGEGSPRLVLRTRTRVDTGRWLRRSRLLLVVTADRIVLLAGSARQYCESIPLSECRDSHYCHTTGQLVIEPAERLRFARVTLDPDAALRVLDLIEQGEKQPEPTPSNATENDSA